MRKDGYYIEHNGDCWQSVFPVAEAHKSQLHTSSDDAFGYMHYECKVPAEAIVILPAFSLTPKRKYPDPKQRKLTSDQKQALKRLWERARTTHPSYLRLRRNAYWETCGDALMVPWCGMVVGIEPDGYTHS